MSKKRQTNDKRKERTGSRNKAYLIPVDEILCTQFVVYETPSMSSGGLPVDNAAWH